MLDIEDYQPQNWHCHLLFWAVLAVAILIITVVLPLVTQGIVPVLHLLGSISILVP